MPRYASDLEFLVSSHSKSTRAFERWLGASNASIARKFKRGNGSSVLEDLLVHAVSEHFRGEPGACALFLEKGATALWKARAEQAASSKPKRTSRRKATSSRGSSPKRRRGE